MYYQILYFQKSDEITEEYNSFCLEKGFDIFEGESEKQVKFML